MLLVSFWDLPNLVTLLSFLSCSHDRESRTHHFHLLNLLHRKIACPYHPLYHTLFMLHTLLESLPNFSPRKAWAMNSKKKMMAHESPWINGHMKVHGSRTWLAMPKIIRRERLYMEHLTLSFSSTTYPHTCTSRSWLYYLFTLFGSIFGFAKYLKQVCLAFLPSISSTLAFLE